VDLLLLDELSCHQNLEKNQNRKILCYCEAQRAMSEQHHRSKQELEQDIAEKRKELSKWKAKVEQDQGFSAPSSLLSHSSPTFSFSSPCSFGKKRAG
jgi:hypothetical protein